MLDVHRSTFFSNQGRVAESGLRHSTRNRAWGNPPWVRIPPLPPKSMPPSGLKVQEGCARLSIGIRTPVDWWGASHAWVNSEALTPEPKRAALDNPTPSATVDAPILVLKSEFRPFLVDFVLTRRFL